MEGMRGPFMGQMDKPERTLFIKKFKQAEFRQEDQW